MEISDNRLALFTVRPFHKVPGQFFLSGFRTNQQVTRIEKIWVIFTTLVNGCEIRQSLVLALEGQICSSVCDGELFQSDCCLQRLQRIRYVLMIPP